jgi:hypothetical protein
VQADKARADNILKTRDQQIKVALNSVDNLTQERMKQAEMTHDAALLQSEQEQTALAALQSAQQNLGGQNG